MNKSGSNAMTLQISHAFFHETQKQILYGEFDPGSGRTLAACLIHASRATKPEWVTTPAESGERVSNTWVTCPGHRDNHGKPWLIPNNPCSAHAQQGKAPAVWDRPAVYQLVGGVTAYQGDDA